MRPADARLRPRRLGRAPRRRRQRRRAAVVVYSPAGRRRSATPSPSAADFALQDEPRGTGDAVRAALAAVPDDATEILVLSGDVPLVTGADLEARPRGAPRGRRRDRPGHGLRRRPGRARAGRPQRVRDGRARSSRPRTRPRTSSTTTRSTPACTPSTPPGCAAGSARSTPSAATGELYLTELVAARPRGRPARQRRRVRRRRPLRRHQRPRPAGRGRVEPARAAATRQHMRDGVTMRDPSTVYLDWDVTLAAGRDPRAERHPARRDDDRGGDASSAPAARSSTARSARTPACGRAIVESSTVEDDAIVGPFSHLRPGSVVGARRRGRQLRRAQEHAPRARAPSSTT